MIFVTFSFNCCMLIDKLDFSIVKIQVIIVTSCTISSLSTLMFLILVLPFRSDCNHIMPTCCTFASLVRSDFNFLMATSFSFTSPIRFYHNPSMTISCIGLMSSSWSFNTFELEINLSRKHWNALRHASFSRDDMLKKVIWNKEKLSVVLRFAQMLVDVIQFCGRKMCTDN
jgi:hypothetical protein